MERGRDVPEAVSEEMNSEGLEREYTVIGIMEDGAARGAPSHHKLARRKTGNSPSVRQRKSKTRRS